MGILELIVKLVIIAMVFFASLYIFFGLSMNIVSNIGDSYSRIILSIIILSFIYTTFYLQYRVMTY